MPNHIKSKPEPKEFCKATTGKTGVKFCEERAITRDGFCREHGDIGFDKPKAVPTCACRGRFSGDLVKHGEKTCSTGSLVQDSLKADEEMLIKAINQMLDKETFRINPIYLHNLAQSCEKREGRNWFLLIATVAWLLTALAVPAVLLAGAWRLVR